MSLRIIGGAAGFVAHGHFVNSEEYVKLNEDRNNTNLFRLCSFFPYDSNSNVLPEDKYFIKSHDFMNNNKDFRNFSEFITRFPLANSSFFNQQRNLEEKTFGICEKCSENYNNMVRKNLSSEQLFFLLKKRVDVIFWDFIGEVLNKKIVSLEDSYKIFETKHSANYFRKIVTLVKEEGLPVEWAEQVVDNGK